MTNLNYEMFQQSTTQKLGLQCPQCASAKYMKYGNVKGKQRYRCKECSKTFHSDYGTPYYRLRKRINTEDYLQAMYDGLTIRQSAKVAGISVKTSFQWRHKFLTSLNSGKVLDRSEITGLKEIKLPFSTKGKSVATHPKRKQSTTLLQKSSSGEIRLIHLPEKKPALVLGGMLNHSSNSCLYVVQPTKLITRSLQISDKLSCCVHDTQIAEAFNEDMRETCILISDWLCRFRGVATKYLSQYWGWFCLISAISDKGSLSEFSLACSTGRNVSLWSLFGRI